METITSHLDAIIIATINAVALVLTAIINARDKSAEKAPQNGAATAATVVCTHSSHARPRATRKPKLSLVFLAWGQADISAALWVGGSGALTAWSLSFVGQGLVMLALGFWLLLRD